MILIMLGMTVAASVFAAVLWSLFQIVTQHGRLRVSYIAAVVFSLAGMASISWVSPTLAMIFGGGLLLSSGAAIYYEIGWNRVFPIFLLVFAGALISGLPFS